MKYIDGDKLIAEIERWRDKAKEKYNESTYSMGRCDALAEFRNHIVSLQQEEPERICPRCVYYNRIDDMCECPHGGMEYFINENGVYKCNMFEKVEQQEQPEVDLERDAVQFCFDKGLNVTPYQAKTIARHFYELGLNVRKEE